MKRLICILVLMLLLCGTIAIGEGFELQNGICFGDNPDTVKSKETLSLSIVQKLDDCTAYCTDDLKLDGIPNSNLNYCFVGNELYQEYHYYRDKGSVSKGKADYEKINKQLIKTLGQPMDKSEQIEVKTYGFDVNDYIATMNSYGAGITPERDMWIFQSGTDMIAVDHIGFAAGKVYKHYLFYVKIGSVEADESNGEAAALTKDGKGKSGLYSYQPKDDGTIAIIDFDEEANGNNDIYVPRQIDGYTVSSIDIWPFNNSKCKGIIVLPDTVTEIEIGAFSESSFSAISIPASVTKIRSGAFANMPNVTIAVDAQNPVYATIDGILYNKQTKAVVACPNIKGGFQITIPDGIQIVEADAFKGIKVALQLPNTLTTINGGAFSKTNLTDFMFPDSVEFIGEGAFSGACFHIESNESGERVLYFPKSLKEMGRIAFYQASFEVGRNNILDLSDTQLEEIPNGAFVEFCGGKELIKAIYLPETLKKSVAVPSTKYVSESLMG